MGDLLGKVFEDFFSGLLTLILCIAGGCIGVGIFIGYLIFK